MFFILFEIRLLSLLHDLRFVNTDRKVRIRALEKKSHSSLPPLPFKVSLLLTDQEMTL